LRIFGGEGKLIRELKLGGVNHDKNEKIGKNCVHARGMWHLPATKKPDTTSSPPLKFNQSQRHILNNPTANLGDIW
jgi:hypothetical protein